MTEGFTSVLDEIVDIQMFVQEKVDGQITTEPLTLDPCSTLDLQNFYDPRKSSKPSLEFIQQYK